MRRLDGSASGEVSLLRRPRATTWMLEHQFAINGVYREAGRCRRLKYPASASRRCRLQSWLRRCLIRPGLITSMTKSLGFPEVWCALERLGFEESAMLNQGQGEPFQGGVGVSGHAVASICGMGLKCASIMPSAGACKAVTVCGAV